MRFQVPATAMIAASILGCSLLAGCAGQLDTVRPVEPASAVESEQRWPSYVTEADRQFLASADTRIDTVRKGELLVNVNDAKGFAVEDVTVRWEQLDRDMAFGVDTPFDPVVWGDLVRIGVTQGAVALDWHAVEPRGGEWTLDQTFDSAGLAILPAMGVAMRGSAGLWMNESGAPEWVRKTDAETLLDIAQGHVRGLVDQLKGSIAVWEALREPNAEWTAATKENPALIELLARTSVEAIRAVDPVTPIAISYTNPVGEGQYLTPVTMTKRLEDAGVEYDIIGLQFYYNGYTRGGEYVSPKHTLQQMAAVITELSRYGKDIHITGVSAPSGINPLDQGLAGFWGERWSPELQATYLRAFYTMALAQPAVKAIVWRDGVDEGSYLHRGGLFSEPQRPKPAFDALRGVIGRIHSGGSAEPNSEGQLRFRGYAGQYRIVVLDNETGREYSVRTRVREQELQTTTVTLPGSWL